MRGVILAIAPDGSYGQLSAEDGQRYSYWTSEVRNGAAQVGHSVDFQISQGQPVDIFIVAAPPRPGAPPPRAAPQAVRQRGFESGAPAHVAYAGNGKFPPADYWIRLFTSPSGRISRRQFWLHGVLPIVVLSILLGWIPVLGFLVTLALTWASICISFKRFHDVGYPGWWSLLIYVPLLVAASLMTGSFFMGGFATLAWWLANIFWVVALLVFIAQMAFVYLHLGQPGPNRYGPDPLSAG
jgi:uncharacterized membrane protein YhaH (DUF805 family)